MYRILSQGRLHYFQSGKQMQSRTQSGFAVQKWHHYAQLRQPGTPDLHTLFIRWKHFSLFQKMERCIPGGSRKSNIPRSSSSPWRHNRLSTTRIISSLSCYHTCLPQTKSQENTSSQKWCRWVLDSTGRDCSLCAVHPGQSVRPIIWPSWLASSWNSFQSSWAWAGDCHHSIDQGSCTRLCTGTTVEITTDVHCRVAHEEIAHMVEPEPTIYTTNMAWCMGMLASKTTQTIYQVGKFAHVGAARATGQSSIEAGGQEGPPSDHSAVRNIPSVCLPSSILRCAAHCGAVRQLLMKQKRSIHAPTILQPRLHCTGGIMLFLDLHRAFDQVPRPTLITALQRTQLDPRMQRPDHQLASQYALSHWGQQHLQMHSSE